MVQTKLPQMTMSSRPPLKEDSFSKLVGHIGLWQLLVIAPVGFIKICSGWYQMAILFLTPTITFWCSEFEGNSTIVAPNNTCFDSCIKYEYDTSPFENTIVSEWDLVCDRSWLASFTQTMLQLGILIGSIIFGFLSDRYGRKNTFLFSLVLLIVFAFSVPFSINYVMFTTLRFLLGMATAGTMVVSFVIVMEAISPKNREAFGCIYQIPFVLGHMTVPVFAYYFRSWNTYCLALAVPAVLFLGYFFTLKESPRWLVSVGRVDDAAEIIKRAAKMNKLPTTNIHETLTKVSLETQRAADAPKLNYWALVGPELRGVTICSLTMWLVAGLTFFGFNQYISQTSADPFISVAVAGAIQIPANILAVLLMRYLGRKTTTAGCFCLAGVTIVTLGCVSGGFWLSLILGSLGVSFAAIVAASVYVYTTELYPTVVRNMGMGLSSMAMRAGSMIAPFVANLNVTLPWAPTVIFGVVPIAAGLVVLLLPETNGRSLPDSIEDVRTSK